MAHLLSYNIGCEFLQMKLSGVQFEYLMEIWKELPDYKYSSLMVSVDNILALKKNQLAYYFIFCSSYLLWLNNI